MRRFSAFSLIKGALSGHRDWPSYWRFPQPKPSYDVIIIGGGGHGLATAYYLAKEHGVRNVAVLERGWLGGGNTGRNTTICRSNYLWDESAHLYEHALKLFEGLSEELNINVMLSQRGVMNLCHTLGDVREAVRRVHANRLNGVDAEWLDAKQVKDFCPIVDISPGARYPVLGATLQRRAGVARHDAVAWGFARAADALGVDIIQDCEVTGFDIAGGKVRGVRTSKGDIGAERIGIVAAGHNSVIAAMAGACRCRVIRCRRWSRSRSSPSTTAWSCRTRCTSTSASPTRASWSWAPASTASTPTRSAARSTSSSTRWPPASSSSLSSAG